MNDEQLLSLFALFNDPIIQSRLSFLRGGGSQEVQNSNFQDSGSAAELPIQRTLSSNILKVVTVISKIKVRIMQVQ
jgi:hypothetical protein